MPTHKHLRVRAQQFRAGHGALAPDGTGQRQVLRVNGSWAGPLNEARSLQIRTAPKSAAAQPTMGYGWHRCFRGHHNVPRALVALRCLHPGAATRIMMIPDLDLGLVVLTNGWPVGAPEAIGSRSPTWWSTGK